MFFELWSRMGEESMAEKIREETVRVGGGRRRERRSSVRRRSCSCCCLRPRFSLHPRPVTLVGHSSVGLSSHPVMALVLIQEHRHWLSDTLMRYGLIKEPLPGLKVLPEEPDSAGDVIVVDEDPDQEYLTQLDPRNWKEQDHYAVLGLKNKRCAASEEEIRRNYRRMILQHHPDKRGHVVDPEQDYFACITKAIEILGDPTKRRSYDSVDPNFDDDIPSLNNNSRKAFFSVFAPVFRLNARWSVTQPVPLLGKPNSARQEVDDFYKFWYNFDSWREYSYQDEEDKERGQDRDERRWIEKENKAIRQRKKKEEMARIRTLVDNAYACDPRIPKFREQDKLSREEEKRKKQEARKQQKEEEDRRQKEQEDEERILRQKDETDQRIKRDADRKERESAKRIRKKIKKQIESVVKECNYFTADNYSQFQALVDVDRIFQSCTMEQLEQLNQFFEQNTDHAVRRGKFFSIVGTADSDRVKPDAPSKLPTDQNCNVQTMNPSKKWSVEDCFVLTKAAKIFPPGTQDRWDVITAYFNQHSASGTSRKTKEVMAKSKELQDPNSGLKDVSNTPNGSGAWHESAATIDSQPSLRDEALAEKPWTADEQKMLEQALITFPKETVKRWDRIGESIPGRTKEQCIKRFKELAAMVQAKREAQKAAGVRKA